MSPHTLYYKLMDYGVNLEDKELQRKYGAYSGQDLARTIYKRYFDSYTGVKDLIEKQKEFARNNGYVETIMKRKIWIPEINSSKMKYKSYGERFATNGSIQGSGGDVIMSAQVNLDESKELKELQVEQLMQIHDKLLCCV